MRRVLCLHAARWLTQVRLASSSARTFGFLPSANFISVTRSCSEYGERLRNRVVIGMRCHDNYLCISSCPCSRRLLENATRAPVAVADSQRLVWRQGSTFQRVSTGVTGRARHGGHNGSNQDTSGQWPAAPLATGILIVVDNDRSCSVARSQPWVPTVVDFTKALVWTARRRSRLSTTKM